MSHQSHPEADLITGLLCQDPDALAAVYDRYAPGAYSLLLRITRNHGVAEELLQELFLRVWCRARHFDPQKGLLRTWILCLARHLGLDYVRSAEARFGGHRQPLEWDGFYRGADQQNAAARLERGALLHAALAQLSVREQQLLQLAYFDGYSQTEIAARLQEPLGTVKSWMRAALQHLRLVLQESGELGAPGQGRLDQPGNP